MYDNPQFQKLVEADQPTGEVVAVDHDLIRVKGLESVGAGALVLFDNGFQGIVREADDAGSLVLNLSPEAMPIGTLVVLQDAVLSINVGDALVGRIVSPLGKPLDGKGPLLLANRRPVFKEAPGVIERALLKDQITTGVAMVDFLFPILRGQRVAILGDSKAGKSAFLTQMTVSQLGTDHIVIWCLVAKRKADVDMLISRLVETGAMAQSIVVVATVFDSLAQAYLAPYAACTMGEYFWYQGGHTIMVYDDLTSHAKVYRELNLLAKGNPGRESYPGDMFYAHSSLLERAGKLAAGEGTQTALPVVLTPNNDITANLPTSLISITDGQIVFDLEKFRQGIRPAVHHGLSVSRVGGRGQNSRQKKLTQRLIRSMIDYGQAADFARFGAQLSDESQAAFDLGKRVYEALKQPPDQIYSITEQELYLSAVLQAPVENELDVTATKLQARELAAEISDEGQLDDGIEKLIEDNTLAPAEEEDIAEAVG